MRTKMYCANNLEGILQQMIEYLEDVPEEQLDFYFADLSQTQFFNDAIGEIIDIKENNDQTFITVLEEY